MPVALPQDMNTGITQEPMNGNYQLIYNNTMEKSYLEFLEKKQKNYILSGFQINENELNTNLFPFQKFIVKRALKAGKYAIFADCGLGKTLMQLEWANQVSRYTNKPVLILAPLAVSGQTIKEGDKFNIKVTKYNGSQDLIQISNYEQLDNIDYSLFSGIVLDESSILKNFEGSIKKSIIDNFKNTPYKLACTATPSPNDPMELGNHSEFLDVMSRNEMLAMYFVHDGGETAKWRLKGHAVKLFYQFIGSWAIMLNKPQDIGFEMQGYNLPELNIFEKQITTPKRDNGSLFNDAIISATNFNQELRLTKVERLDEAAKIVNGSDENFIIWIKQNEEGELLKKLIPEAIEVKGSDSPEYKEKMLLGFANNEFRVLITKTKIAQFGLNYQNCRNQIFASLDFSFEGLYQAIRRSYRFGQKNQVNIYLITTDTMSNVNESIKQKQKQFEIMQDEMSNAINANLSGKVMKSGNYDITEEKTEWYHIKRGDCVQLISELKDNSIGLSVFSPPFAELYTYSNHIEDMGNSKNYEEFLTQFGYLIKELYRVMKEGRNVCVHCMDLPIQKGKEGFIGLRDFSGMILKAFEDAGFIYASRVTIWKDPVVEMQRTKALGLLHKQVKKDSTMSRVGIPDYVMIFRKDGERTDPVTNTNMSVDLWQKIASPVWMDIDYGNTLQGYRNGRDENDEKHICPLQLDTIERLILLYSNEGDTVFTPFMGIGSEVYQAVKMNRKGIGFELKESYYNLAKNNLKNSVQLKKQLSIL
jgi:DNA modification methylase